MKTAERRQAERLAGRHREFLDRLAAERALRAQAEAREREAREARLAELREQKRRERQAELLRNAQFERERAERVAEARAARVSTERAATRPVAEKSVRERPLPRAAAAIEQPRVRVAARARRSRIALSTARPPVPRVYRLTRPSKGLRAAGAVRPTAPGGRVAGPAQAPQNRKPRALERPVKPRAAGRRPVRSGASHVRPPRPKVASPRGARRTYRIARLAVGGRLAVRRPPRKVRVPASASAPGPLVSLTKQTAQQRARRQAQQPPAQPRKPQRQAVPAAKAERRVVVAPPVRQLYALAKPSAPPPAPPAAAKASTAPAAPVPESSDAIRWLRTHDGYVVDGNGRGVVFRGVTVGGLDVVAPTADQTVADALGLNDAGLSTIVDLWELNVIRVPFQAQTVLAGNGALSNTDVLTGLDNLIEAVSDAGAYVMLSQRAPQGVALPDGPVFEAWDTVATRYADEPAVLFEPFASESPLDGNWLDAALPLVGLIRSQHPGSLLFVGNGTGRADLDGLPLRFSTGDPAPNVVYTIAVDPAHPPNGADARLAEWTDSFPLVACPWSNGGPPFDRASELAADFFSRYGLGWIASSWNVAPRLVVDAAGGDLTPTAWGLTVRRAVALPTRPQYGRILSG